MTEILPIAAKIGLSALLGGAVGAEREWTGKWAGLRTHMLIAVGAALLTDLSIRIGPDYAAGSAAWDPGRIAAQIVTGVGFIGAGTIIQARGSVHGLTTAAGLWVAAAIGMAVGASYYLAATLGTAALLLILAALPPVESLMTRGRQSLQVECDPERPLADLFRLLDQEKVVPHDIRLSLQDGRRRIEMEWKGRRPQTERLLARAAEAGFDVGTER